MARAIRLGVALGSVLIGAGTFACVPSRGGWDVEALWAAEPAAAAVEGQRLGDMTPYPAISEGRLLLVACRFSAAHPVRVRRLGEGWPEAWVESAVSAVDGAVKAVDLELTKGGPDSTSKVEPEIDLVLIEGHDAEGPRGLGDTLSECDVSGTGTRPASIRGEMRHAEIRMRRSQRANTGLVQSASHEEWIGALMHELGHALGFSGHVPVGSSILVLEESRLRAFARRAIAGQPFSDPTLDALYRVAPGRLLGEAELSAKGRDDLAAVQALVSEWNRRWGQGSGPIASVGDQQARIRWRWREPGQMVEVTFPRWRHELRAGQAITLLPSRATRRALQATARHP